MPPFYFEKAHEITQEPFLVGTLYSFFHFVENEFALTLLARYLFDKIPADPVVLRLLRKNT
jgi:hypothetical protein